MSQETRFSLPQSVIQATVDYLATKPYREVVHLLNALDKNAEEVKPVTGEGNGTAD